ncbi:MAG: CusA/CzcA family heavy metal efflux RND transporter [Azonexaceae bacterium]|nr:CusA/CzcA family heavy metal efflux RND transporter [Azonexaceae bacterium]
MIKRIVHFALHQPLYVVLGLLLFIGAGIAAFRSLPIEAFPDVTDTQVTVISLFPGRAPEEVEKQVTIPLEIAMSGVPNSIRMFSHTQFGLSYIVVTFDDKISLFMARQLVEERLRGVDLPDGVEPELAPPATATGEIFRYRLDAPGTRPSEVRAVQDWVVARQLKQVPGVADVVSLGGPVRQYEVNPDLARMRDAKVTLGQLFGALQRANANAGGGSVAAGRQQYLIRSIGRLASSADIGEVLVAENGGVAIRVRDVAQVVESRIPAQGIVGYTDATQEQDDVVTGIVLLRKDENPSQVLEALKAKVDKLNESGLPEGVQLVPYYDRSWLIAKTLTTVFSNLLEGAALVMLVLYLFLADFRAAGIVASIIPLALLGTFIGLSLVGIPANLLSLGAMDFGIIVDGAVIVIENIFRRLGESSHAGSQRPRVRTIQEAVAEVGRPTVFSMIIIIVAHLPIFTMQRHEGKIFAPMAYSVVAALITSLILSLTLVPFLSKIAFRNSVPHEETRLMHKLHALYEPLLAWAMNHARRILGIAVLALAVTAALIPRLGTEFLPELNEGSIWINITLPTSISVDEARSELRKLRRIIADFPEVNAVVSKAGRPEDGSDPKNINMTEMLVDLKPDSAWRPGMTKEKLVREMEDKLNDMPGIEPTFSQPVRDQILESISQIDGQIVIKLYGDDLDLLRSEGRQVLSRIAKVPGVDRAFIDRDGELPQYRLEIDRAAAARYGLNVGDVQDVVETALAGKAATELWEGERHFSVVVRLAEPQRALDRLKDVLVPTPSGAQVPLSALVDFKLSSGAMNIARESGQRVLAIGVFIRDRDMGSVVADMQQATRDMQLPAGYSITWSGEFENQERAMKRLMLVVPLSVLMIFILLFDAFKSFRDALIIICNIPFAMIGGIFALLLSGIPLSVSAAIGFIALFGQAVLNGVVMVSYINQLRQEGVAVYEAVARGALSRLRTVLMTACLAMLGLLPMALSHGIGAETQRPLALVVIGGLISATLLTLFVLPALYYYVATHPRLTKAMH